MYLLNKKVTPPWTPLVIGPTDTSNFDPFYTQQDLADSVSEIWFSQTCILHIFEVDFMTLVRKYVLNPYFYCLWHKHAVIVDVHSHHPQPDTDEGESDEIEVTSKIQDAVHGLSINAAEAEAEAEAAGDAPKKKLPLPRVQRQWSNFTFDGMAELARHTRQI